MAATASATEQRVPVATRASSVPSLVNKAAAAIHIRNDISCLQRKLWNVLLSNAYDELPDRDIQFHEIRVKDLMEEVGFDSKNVAYLKQALEDMVTTKLTWNILDDKGKQEWGVSAALASASISGGICYYSYSAHLRPKLHNPEIFAPIPLGVLRRFGGGHALALYENCLRYRLISQTPWFSLDVFRDLLGVGDNGSYDDFKVLNRAVIKPSMQEVNTVSDIHLELELKREKRKVVGIKFVIDGNQQASLPIDAPDNNFNHELLTDLQEKFCLSEKQSKEILVTHSDERIGAVMRYVEERYRAGAIKEGKIAPYFLSTIKSYDHANSVSSIDKAKQDERKAREIAADHETKMGALREEFISSRTSQVEAHCGGLEQSDRDTLLGAFEEYLQNHNGGVLQFYRKNGLKSKAAYSEFIKFVAERILPPFDVSFNAFLKQKGFAEG